MMNEAFPRFACCWLLAALVLPGWAAATPDFRPRGRALALPVADNDRALAPALAMDVDGDFAMAWSEQDQGSGFRSQIFLRRFRGAEPIDLAAVVRDNLGRGRAAVAGEELRYTAIVKNLHAPLRSSGVAAIDRAFGAARGVEAILTLPLRPARRVVFEPRDRGRCRVLPGAVRCTLEGPLAVDTQARIRFRLTPTTQEQLTSSMSVFSAALESRRQLENNTAIEITNVGSAPHPPPRP